MGATKHLSPCTYEKEALAIIFCVTHFRPYLYGRKFTLVTDLKPLVWFQNSKDPCSRVSRWRLKLVEYYFDVVYKAGKMNVNADALSRNPIINEKKSKNLHENDDDTFMTSQEKMNLEAVIPDRGSTHNQARRVGVSPTSSLRFHAFVC